MEIGFSCPCGEKTAERCWRQQRHVQQIHVERTAQPCKPTEDNPEASHHEKQKAMGNEEFVMEEVFVVPPFLLSKDQAGPKPPPGPRTTKYSPPGGSAFWPKIGKAVPVPRELAGL